MTAWSEIWLWIGPRFGLVRTGPWSSFFRWPRIDRFISETACKNEKIGVEEKWTSLELKPWQTNRPANFWSTGGQNNAEDRNLTSLIWDRGFSIFTFISKSSSTNFLVIRTTISKISTHLKQNRDQSEHRHPAGTYNGRFGVVKILWSESSKTNIREKTVFLFNLSRLKDLLTIELDYFTCSKVKNCSF